MTITINAQGTERKRLVQAISKWLDIPAKYCGAPTFHYEVGPATVDKSGSLTITDALSDDVIERLLQYLYDEGFEMDMRTAAPTEEEPADESSGICISMPRDLFTDAAIENLNSILRAKGHLIRKALDVADIPVEITDTKVSFPWFPGTPGPEELKAYDAFICKLCEMARTQKRVTAKEKAVDNEKYAFRCFLLRLGFIGAEHKESRKILLRNLTGSSSLKGGQPKEVLSCE